jgi:membrane protein
MASIPTEFERRSQPAGDHSRRRHAGLWRLAQLVAIGLALRRHQAPPSESDRTADRAPAADRREQPAPAPAAGDAPGAAEDSARGRQAEAPREIPARGWKDIVVRTVKEFGDDQIPLISAGITFYVLLALFPALAALVSIYGLFADPAEASRHLQSLSGLLPQGAAGFLGEQMTRIAGAHSGSLSIGFVGGLLASIWSANGAMKAMIAGMNIAYDETEKRKFVAKTLTSLAFTLGFMAFAIVALAAIGLAPAAGRLLGHGAGVIVAVVSWPLLLVALGGGLAALYRFGPSRDRVKWRWISWGSAAATLLWLAFSALFSLYLANFADYNKTYGSLGAAIGFMMWIYVSSQVVLLGAELNSEMEHQTAKDTTVGAEQPLGARGAVMADSVGAAQGR